MNTRQITARLNKLNKIKKSASFRSEHEDVINFINEIIYKLLPYQKGFWRIKVETGVTDLTNPVVKNEMISLLGKKLYDEFIEACNAEIELVFDAEDYYGGYREEYLSTGELDEATIPDYEFEDDGYDDDDEDEEDD